MPEASVSDASRRTHLANERTYLAWWRTALTAYAAGLGAGKLVPELSSGSTWPYTAIGVALVCCGVVCSVYALRRHAAVRRALRDGTFADPDETLLAFLAGAGAALGVAMVVALLAA